MIPTIEHILSGNATRRIILSEEEQYSLMTAIREALKEGISPSRQIHANPEAKKWFKKVKFAYAFMDKNIAINIQTS